MRRVALVVAAVLGVTLLPVAARRSQNCIGSAERCHRRRGGRHRIRPRARDEPVGRLRLGGRREQVVAVDPRSLLRRHRARRRRDGPGADQSPAARSRQRLDRRGDRRFGHGVRSRFQPDVDVRQGDLGEPIRDLRVERLSVSQRVESGGAERADRQGVRRQRRRAPDPGIPQHVPHRRRQPIVGRRSLRRPDRCASSRLAG